MTDQNQTTTQDAISALQSEAQARVGSTTYANFASWLRRTGFTPKSQATRTTVVSTFFEEHCKFALGCYHSAPGRLNVFVELFEDGSKLPTEDEVVVVTPAWASNYIIREA